MLALGAAACVESDPKEPPPPETRLLRHPEALTASSRAVFEFEASVAASFQCVLDGVARPCRSPLELTVQDGLHMFAVWAIDDNQVADRTPALWQWVADTTPPNTTFLSTPARNDNTPSPTFTFFSEYKALITCSLDGGPREICTSPYQVGPLADGPHTLSLAATDVAGNVQREPASYSWTLDTTTPDVTFDQTPPSLGNQRDVTFTFSATTGASLRCVIDGVGRSPCASPMTFSVGDGAHELVVTATNAVGTVDPTPARFAFAVDSVAPTLSLPSLPPYSTSNDLSFSFSSNEASLGFECALVAGAGPPTFAPCTSPYLAQDVAEGPASFTVRLTDPAGNTTSRTTTTIVDTIAPTLTWLERPAERSADTTPTFAFQTAGADFVECRLGSLAFAPCSSPVTLVLGQGLYAYQVRVRDHAGHSTTLSTTFEIDVSAPWITFTATPNASTAATSATFAFTIPSADVQTVECSYDTASFAPCTSPVEIPALTLGQHVFRVRATDTLGNQGMRTHYFYADPRPISITFTGGPTGDTTDRTPFFYWTSTVAQSQACRHDAEPYEVSCGSVMLTPLADGPHTFYVRITNDRGETLVATRSFTVDTVAPTATITGGPSGTITTPSGTFTFTTSGDPVVTECRLFRDGAATGSYAPCSSPHDVTLAPPSTPYPYVFEVRVVDRAGNLWSAYRSFTYTTP